MTKILYRGTCRTCSTVHEREWNTPWNGGFQSDWYAAECRQCGPGYLFAMDPVDPELDAVDRELAPLRQAA